jgi:hypothetical protein
MLSFFRKVIDSAFPEGPPHEPKEDGSYANWRDAVGSNFETIREDVKNLIYIRDPSHTPILDDLEREFGRTKNVNLTEDERRDQLEADRFKKRTNATDDDLQKLLDKQGFNLTVYNNSPEGPAIDPDIVLFESFQLQAKANTNYYAGNETAFASALGGELLVNGDEFSYPIPATAANWPFVFFVGGNARFDPITGEITGIARTNILSSRQQQLETLILKFKPLHAWCGLIVNYV